MTSACASTYFNDTNDFPEGGAAMYSLFVAVYGRYLCWTVAESKAGT